MRVRGMRDGRIPPDPVRPDVRVRRHEYEQAYNPRDAAGADSCGHSWAHGAELAAVVSRARAACFRQRAATLPPRAAPRLAGSWA